MLIIWALEGRGYSHTIARQKLTWVKATILKDFQEICAAYQIPVTPRINVNRPEQVYYINGSEFAFFGLDYPEKLHGRAQDIFWINEGMEVDRMSFDQLEMRTRLMGIIDYNPYDDTHWIFALHARPDVAVIRSTWWDNKENLPRTIINKILGYEPTPENIAKGTADAYMWSVYGLGEKAMLKGVIFPYWDIVESIPENARDLGLGLDFGYTNDPTALVEIYEMDNELYLNELIYERGLTNTSPYEEVETISKRLKLLEIGNRDITADSSEPKSIQELGNDGWQVDPADKGPDSVSHGIDLMKSYKIHITRRSINLDAERRKYKWAEDKNGKSLQKPIDEFNHLIDAARYRISKVLGGWTEVELHSSADVL